MYKLPAQGIDAPNEALEQKLMWMREAASERFESLELSQMALCLLSMLVESRGMLRETVLLSHALRRRRCMHRQLRIEGK